MCTKAVRLRWCIHMSFHHNITAEQYNLCNGIDAVILPTGISPALFLAVMHVLNLLSHRNPSLWLSSRWICLVDRISRNGQLLGFKQFVEPLDIKPRGWYRNLLTNFPENVVPNSKREVARMGSGREPCPGVASLLSMNVHIPIVWKHYLGSCISVVMVQRWGALVAVEANGDLPLDAIVWHANLQGGPMHYM